MKRKLKVAILYNETMEDIREVEAGQGEAIPFMDKSLPTPDEEFKAIARALKRSGYSAEIFNIEDDLDRFFGFLDGYKPDAVFNLIEIFKFLPQLESHVAGFYHLLKIPYTGSSPLVLSNCQNKILVKRVLKSNGINTANFYVAEKPVTHKVTGLSLPLILKPAFEDASVGIENASVVRDKDKFGPRLKYMLKRFKQPIIIEEFIEGRELNVAIFGYPHLRALPISEIDFTAMPDHLENIVSYEAKWDENHESYHKTVPVCPSVLPLKTERKAKEIAVRAGKLMGITDYARVDMRLREDGELFVLEVNPNPDLTEGAGFMRSAHAAGYSLSQALDLIVKLALRKKFA